jgi:hypothetical protein
VEAQDSIDGANVPAVVDYMAVHLPITARSDSFKIDACLSSAGGKHYRGNDRGDAEMHFN